jgi:predicted acetyltransferase
MSDERLELVDPREELREAYLDMAEEFLAAGERHWVQQAEEARRDFAGFVRKFADHARGVGLRPERVAYNDYWLLRDGRMLGRLNFRHRLTEHLLREGGHIGFCIRPSERGRGYGTRQLAMALERVRAFGLPRVLITCDVENAASARVIEKNGGVYEDARVCLNDGQFTARYWIDLGERGCEGKRHGSRKA